MKTDSFDFSACFSQAWETYKKNMLLLIGASFVASVLVSATIGILAGPILAGLMILILKILDGDSSAKFEDIFSQFDTFKVTFLLCLAWGVGAYIVILILMLIPIIGTIASLLVSVAVSAFLLFAVLLAAEEKLDFMTASTRSFEILKANLWPLLGYTAVASILSSAGAIACGIGVIVTLPMFYLMMASAYRNCSVESAEETIEPPASPAEAPVETPAEEPKEEEEEDGYIDLTEPENQDEPKEKSD